VQSEYTRTGVRRAGDDYQDAIALEILIEMLEHPDRYQYVRVEADDAGFLDDVVALRSDGSFVVKQVKFSAHPELETDVWTWEKLLEQRKSTSEKLLPSLLEKWASSLKQFNDQKPVYEASVISNRRAADELQVTLSPEGLVDFNKISDAAIREMIVYQLGGEAIARGFFTEFHFRLDHPGIETLENSLRRRIYSLGVKEEGWLNLKDELRSWIRNRNQPPPDGKITLVAVRNAALWHQLQSLPEEFEIPKDYVLPSESFHEEFVQDLLTLPSGCIVLTGSPGVGKSTYLSYLFKHLIELEIPIIRHHYFLSLSDRTFGRLDHKMVAESLMSDIQKRFPESLGSLATKNPASARLSEWVNACGRYFTQKKKALIIIIDGLDHIWREQTSIQELDKLFEHLLPAPEGIVILFGTQPLDERQLPSRLRRAAQPGQWRELPLLDRGATKSWIQHHENEFDLPKEQQAHNILLNRLVDAFYEKSQGHPLHLRYTLRTLQERNLGLTPDNIASLPACPHRDIIQYYEELWTSLPEEGAAILHLFASCHFTWPVDGVIECLELQTKTIDQVNLALRQIRHLLMQDALGLKPFHSSLLQFVEARPDHRSYAPRMKRYALEWLRTKAPEYMRRSNEWLIEADLGNEGPLIEGPNRAWVVEAIAKRYSRQNTSEILARSGWSSLQHRGVSRFIEVGLLRDYLNIAYDFRSEILDTLLYPQLIVEEDPYLRSRLEVDMGNLTENELVLLSEIEAGLSNQPLVHECFFELNERLKGNRIAPKVRASGDWRLRVGYILRVAALNNNVDSSDVVDYAIKNKEHGYSSDVLAIYAEALRTYRVPSRLRQLLKADLKGLEHSVILRHAVLLAFEEGIDLSSEISVSDGGSDSFASIYAALRKVKTYQIGNIQFPPVELFSLRESEQFIRQNEIEELFYASFFCFLANHLWRQDSRNQEWLQKVTGHSWPQSLLRRLNDVAAKLAQLLLTGTPASFGWFYDQLKSLKRPSFPEDRDAYRYGLCAQEAANRISLDILTLNVSQGKTPEITVDDLEIAFTSDYCLPWKWIEVYVNGRRKWLNDETAEWLLQKQCGRLSSLIETFSERASHFSALATLAALHGMKKEASQYIRETASNLVSYGDHKDILLFWALDIIQICHRANLPEAKEWLLRLTPLIANVKDFTDGDETRHLPQELANVLTEVVPALLPAYYRWLCKEEEYDDALNAFHSFLRMADLSTDLNRALAKTAMDDESLLILAERTEKGDDGTKVVLASLLSILGESVIEKARSKKSKSDMKIEFRPREESLPLPSDFPPDRFAEYLSTASRVSLLHREEILKQWIEYWAKEHAEEAYSAIKKEVDNGIELTNYDAVFDLALCLYGRDEAYPWLIKAQAEHYGWYYESEGFPRWDVIKKLYTEKWFDFILQTIEDKWNEPWRYPTVYNWLHKLVEYLLFMEKTEAAEQAAKQVITSTIELVSPLKFPTPEWVKNA